MNGLLCPLEGRSSINQRRHKKYEFEEGVKSTKGNQETWRGKEGASNFPWRVNNMYRRAGPRSTRSRPEGGCSESVKGLAEANLGLPQAKSHIGRNPAWRSEEGGGIEVEKLPDTGKPKIPG